MVLQTQPENAETKAPEGRPEGGTRAAFPLFQKAEKPWDPAKPSQPMSVVHPMDEMGIPHLRYRTRKGCPERDSKHPQVKIKPQPRQKELPC